METKELLEDKIYFLERPILFNLEVAGRRRTAEFLWAKRAGEGEYCHRIKFSDGHEDTFRFSGLEVYAADHNTRDAYTHALEDEAYVALWAWEPEDEIYILNHPVTGESLWIVKHKSDSCFSCYFHNDLAFQIEEIQGTNHKYRAINRETNEDIRYVLTELNGILN